MKVEITKGDGSGEVIECTEQKGTRLINAGVAVETDKPVTNLPAEEKPKPDKKASKSN